MSVLYYTYVCNIVCVCVCMYVWMDGWMQCHVIYICVSIMYVCMVCACSSATFCPKCGKPLAKRVEGATDNYTAI